MDLGRRTLLGALFVGTVLVVDGFLLIEQDNTAEGMVWIETDTQALDSDVLPTNLAESSGFWIDTEAITDEEFENFVQATGYVASELWQSTSAEPGQEWTIAAESTHKSGKQDSLHVKDHQFANQDARAYCRWLGKQLSSEHQTELAMQGAATQISHDGFHCVMHHRTNSIVAIWLN